MLTPLRDGACAVTLMLEHLTGMPLVTQTLKVSLYSVGIDLCTHKSMSVFTTLTDPMPSRTTLELLYTLTHQTILHLVVILLSEDQSLTLTADGAHPTTPFLGSTDSLMSPEDGLFATPLRPSNTLNPVT